MASETVFKVGTVYRRGDCVRLKCCDKPKDGGEPRKWLIVGIKATWGPETPDNFPGIQYVIRSVQPAYNGESPVEMGVSAMEILPAENN